MSKNPIYVYIPVAFFHNVQHIYIMKEWVNEREKVREIEVKESGMKKSECLLYVTCIYDFNSYFKNEERRGEGGGVYGRYEYDFLSFFLSFLLALAFSGRLQRFHTHICITF
jgi:hypothetical protein